MKYSKRELFSIRWSFRENRNGVINEKRTKWKRLNLLNEDYN
jgi:hypothetical protein